MSAGAHRLRAAPLLERDRELERIAAALASSRDEAGAALVVEGSAGIGKTALLACAQAHAAASGMHVLTARGIEVEAGYPFGLVRQLLEPALRTAGRRERERLLAGAAGLAAPIVTDAPGDESAASYGVLHGLYWLVANLAERRPLLLTIDDAHWSDEPSLRFALHLRARIESLPVALIIATRPAGDTPDGPAPLAELLADRPGELLVPAPLGERAVAELLGHGDAGAVDEEFARACHHAAGGNPFLLTELERTLREEEVPFTKDGATRVGEMNPPQVARAVRARLARLRPDARALARAAVVLGDGSPLGLVAELAGLEAPAATAAAGDLQIAGLVEADRTVRFRHPLLRSAIAASMTLADREASHRAAARLLRARREPPERIAVHLLATTAAGDPADLRTLRLVAARAVERGAPEGAAPLLERALEEPVGDQVRAELQLDLGRAELASGRFEAAVEHLEAVVRSADDVVLRARALVPLLQNISVRNRAEFGARLAIVPPTIDQVASRDRELWLRLLAYRVISADLSVPLAPDQLDALASLPGDTPGEAVVLAHSIFPRIKRGATAGEIAAIAERAAKQLDALIEDGSSAIAFSAVILGLRWADRLDLAERLLNRAIEVARRRGSMLDFANSLDLRAELHIRRGMLRDAEADARDSLAAGIERSWLFARGVKPLLQSLAGQGRTDEAEAIVEHEFGDAPLPDSPPMIGLVYARAEVLAAAGRHAAALTAFDEAATRSASLGGTSPSQIGDMLIAARSHQILGDVAAARGLLDEARALAERWDTPGARGEVLHAQASLERGDAQLALLHEAVGQLARSPARLVQARALVDLGAGLRRAGLRRDARGPLTEGYELAHVCGAEPVVSTAREELAATGVRLRRERLTGGDSLTPSETRIARMVVEGGSNAEIAQALFVTVKTVEMHLTNIYRKLGVSGRQALRGALADAGRDR
jgi:DNA-binding CsgD family transcriptional regulator